MSGYETSPSLLGRLVRLGMVGLALVVAWNVVVSPAKTLWSTHSLVQALATQLPDSATIAEARRAVADQYRLRAPTEGALLDADLDVARIDRKLVVTATGVITARLAKCCSLTYDADLASNQPLITLPFGGTP